MLRRLIHLGRIPLVLGSGFSVLLVVALVGPDPIGLAGARVQRCPENALATSGAPRPNLLLVTHGWNSNADGWVKDLAQDIQEQLIARRTLADWDVVAYDWRDAARTRAPWRAKENAEWIGTSCAGPEIRQRSYRHVHLISHSAGAWLVDRAAAVVARESVEGKAPTIQITFLDAYTPLGETGELGAAATYAEHYLNDDGLTVPDTNATLPNAYNVDVTGLGHDRRGPDGHAWPHEWYLATVRDPTGSPWGFAKSSEYGELPDHRRFPRGQIVKLAK